MKYAINIFNKYNFSFIKINVIIYLFSFFSCSKEIEYRFPDPPKKLIVYCVFDTATVWSVYVGKPAQINNIENDLSVTNANVLLYENNLLVEELKQTENGKYKSLQGLKPKPESLYHIEVKAPDFETAVSKQAAIPKSMAEISAIKFEHNVSKEHFAYVIENFSHMLINAHTFYLTANMPDYTEFQVTDQNDSIIYHEFSDSFYSNFEHLTANDAIIKPKHNLQSEQQLIVAIPIKTSTKTLKFRLSTVSADYVNYYRSLENQYQAKYYFYLPSNNAYTNITNGFGLFAGKTNSKFIYTIN
ncbi:MAG TPA: hypothetical protein DCQ31_12180 [Bacteroidales bacterium]|nr:hypothetical protein [Bacteroidales bacterium]